MPAKRRGERRKKRRKKEKGRIVVSQFLYALPLTTALFPPLRINCLPREGRTPAAIDLDGKIVAQDLHGPSIRKAVEEALGARTERVRR